MAERRVTMVSVYLLVLSGQRVVSILRGPDMVPKRYERVSLLSLKRLARACRCTPGETYAYSDGWAWSRKKAK